MTHPTWILIADAAQARLFASEHGYAVGGTSCPSTSCRPASATHPLESGRSAQRGAGWTLTPASPART